MTTSTEPPRSEPRRRAARLSSAGVILEAATTLFLQKGYAGTSMDEVASLAGVSKQTVYTHFSDKERLFSDLVLRNTDRVDAFVDEIATILVDTADLDHDLRSLARRYMASVIQPTVLQLRRLMIGEAARFPDLAKAYYDRVPERVVAALAAHLQRLTDRGVLRVPDPVLAANHLVALLLWVPLDRAMFRMEQQSLSPGELDSLADAGVRVFLAAYRVS